MSILLSGLSRARQSPSDLREDIFACVYRCGSFLHWHYILLQLRRLSVDQLRNHTTEYNTTLGIRMSEVGGDEVVRRRVVWTDAVHVFCTGGVEVDDIRIGFRRSLLCSRSHISQVLRDLACTV